MAKTGIIHRAAMLALACLLPLATLSLGSRSAHAVVTITDWFRLGPEALKDWDASAQPNNGNHVRIKPKRTLSSQPLRRILVLYPRRGGLAFRNRVANSRLVGLPHEPRPCVVVHRQRS